VLILGPVAVSLALVVLSLAGLLPLEWPAVLLLVVLVNLAGDVAYAIGHERDLKRGRVALHNDIVGRSGVVEAGFEGRRPDSGWVRIDGARWRAAADAAVSPGNAVVVTGRNGLVLRVAPVREADSAAGNG
jgi:membrane protein implicated in regulation of membrane protease activity